MERVTKYKCIFQTNEERFKFALTLAGSDRETDFVVSDPDAAETLLDMFEDARAAHFDSTSGQLTFAFEDLESDEEDSDEDQSENDDDNDDEAESEAAEAREPEKVD